MTRLGIRACILGTSLWAALFYATAWVTEDAFITLRVVDNLWAGQGLTWNPGERVQVYTHPLWLFLLLPLVKVLGDAYAATLLLCAVFSLVSVLLLLCLPRRSRLGPALAMLALPFSKAFVDYMSSGLENPLTHALLGLFVWNWLRSGPRRLLAAMLLASLLYLTRPDALLLVALPCLWLLVHEARRQPISQLVGPLLLGLLPALVWTLFSLLYYGAPVPNTALAKVGTGIERADLALQAWAYLRHTAARDPFTLALISLALAQGLTRSWRPMLPFALSLLLWLLYLPLVGADYMEGRFLSAAFCLACCMLASQARVERSQAVAALVLGGAALLSVPTLAVTLGSPADYRDQRISASGIADERGHYYWALGLRPVLQAGSWQVHPWLQEGQALAAQPAHYVRCTVGMVAQAAGPQAYWVDPLALTDAFLARLPARASTRIGHAERALPPGYLPALLGDSSGLPPALRPLFDDVRRVTRDPLLDLPRLQALLRLLRTPLPVRAPGYDPDAAHLPGLRATRQDQLSCLGIPIGSDLIWKFEGPPLMLSNERPLEPAR